MLDGSVGAVSSAGGSRSDGSRAARGGVDAADLVDRRCRGRGDRPSRTPGERPLVGGDAASIPPISSPSPFMTRRGTRRETGAWFVSAYAEEEGAETCRPPARRLATADTSSSAARDAACCSASTAAWLCACAAATAASRSRLPRRKGRAAAAGPRAGGASQSSSRPGALLGPVQFVRSSACAPPIGPLPRPAGKVPAGRVGACCTPTGGAWTPTSIEPLSPCRLPRPRTAATAGVSQSAAAAPPPQSPAPPLAFDLVGRPGTAVLSWPETTFAAPGPGG